MKSPRVLSLLLSLTATLTVSATVQKDFLEQHDLQWQELPTRWEEAAFIGNGDLGATIHLNDGRLSWEINRISLYVQSSRVPVGHLTLDTAGTIQSGDMRLNLWDAEASGTLQTDKGNVLWRSIVLREPDLIVIEVGTPDGKNLPDVSWHPALARPARTTYNQAHPLRRNAPREEYKQHELHPPANVRPAANGFIATQTYINSGASAIVSHAQTTNEGKRLFYISLAQAANEEQAIAKARTEIDKALAAPANELFTAHRAWWHAYYPQSAVALASAPDVETFYWRQIYKFGSAMRPDGPILDLLGPWFRTTRWPRIWWNLNLQLTYAPLASSNRLELAESLFTNLDRNREQLIDNVKPQRPQRDAAAISRASDPNLNGLVRISRTDGNSGAKEAGNLPWVSYLYWEFYRSQMDDQILRERVFPLLALSMGHYLTHTETDDQGVIHLKETYSPEFALVTDANYDLSLFRWGLQTLIESCERLNMDDPRLPLWKDTLARLTPFPTDANGLLIGKDKPLDIAHRHYSHLLAIYPLHLLNLDDPQERELAERSVNHWLKLEGGYRTGFSFTGAASILAALGRGDEALAELNNLLSLSSGDGRSTPQLHPNTLYTEGGGPVIESPLSVVSVVNEMLLQSWGGKVRVYPATPSSWQDASFEDLRAQGAFLVSATRVNGETTDVSIQSLAGEPLILKVTDWSGPLQAEPNRAIAITENVPGEYAIDLKKGERITLRPAAAAPKAPR